MTTCDTLRDRMPDVAWGRDAFGDDDRAHLAACAECRAEWALVSDGLRLAEGITVDADRLAERLAGRLRDEAREAPVRRLPWRGVGLGVAAAASIALVLWAPRRERSPIVQQPVAAAARLLPELERLDEKELRQVLVTVEGGDAADASPASLPRLGDLTETELEQMLQELGG